jgi:hypothetical protein
MNVINLIANPLTKLASRPDLLKRAASDIATAIRSVAAVVAVVQAP